MESTQATLHSRTLDKEIKMKRNWMNTGFLAAALIVSSTFGGMAQTPQGDKPGDGVFVHISHGSDSPHRLLMALKMAVTMSEAGKDVLVYCDIEAVKVLVSGAQAVTFADFLSSDEYLKRLGELKVSVLACPTCMKIAKIEPKDLRPGVGVAQRDLFFSFTKGRILSLDY
jgi:predicted peroxiredoxin